MLHIILPSYIFIAAEVAAGSRQPPASRCGQGGVGGQGGEGGGEGGMVRWSDGTAPGGGDGLRRRDCPVAADWPLRPLKLTPSLACCLPASSASPTPPQAAPRPLPAFGAAQLQRRAPPRLAASLGRTAPLPRVAPRRRPLPPFGHGTGRATPVRAASRAIWPPPHRPRSSRRGRRQKITRQCLFTQFTLSH